MKTKYHRDGTVTYWSIYEQGWYRTHHVPDRELAAMDAVERDRVMRHVEKSQNFQAAVEGRINESLFW